MAWKQYVQTCEQAVASGGLPVDDGHDTKSCLAITCADDQDGRVAWTSHAPASIDAATRINPDVPAEDWR